MQTKTHIKDAVPTSNHKPTLVQAPGPTAGLKVKTRAKAGGVSNHNQTLVRARAR